MTPMCAPRRNRWRPTSAASSQQVPVHEGQLVKKGDVLLRLDPRQFQIAVQAAKANAGGVVSDLNARS